MWSTAELAGIVGLTTRRINGLIRDGHLPKPETRAGHDPKVVIPAYLKYLKAQLSKGSYDDEKTRLTRARAAQIEFSNQVAQGRYIPVDEVRVSAFNTGRVVRDALFNMPARIGSILAAESDSFKVEKILEKEVRESLEGLNGDSG